MKRLAWSLVVSLVASSVSAANWPHWRGPNYNGSSDERNLPDRWSRSENIVWSADLAGTAASTPVVWGDCVLLSGVDAKRDVLQALCLDRATGKPRWVHDVGRGIRRDMRSNFAAGSPATDGRVAIFFYGNGELVAYDLAGKRLWGRNLETDYGPFAFLWTFSSSPLLYEGKLYLQVLQRDVPVAGRGRSDRQNDSYLLALDPATGKELWRTVRPSQAVEESRESFASPIPFEHAGRKEILVVGGDAQTGHDSATGKELWRWETWNPEKVGHWRHVPSPVAGLGTILVAAPKREPVYAIKAGLDGQHADAAILWTTSADRELTVDVPTPAFYDGDFFLLSDLRKTLARVDPKTGKAKWAVATPGSAKYEASPLAADGKIYAINFEGEASVFDAASGKLLRTIAMDDPTGGEVVRSSIAVAEGQLFLRTTRKLYCIGQRR